MNPNAETTQKQSSGRYLNMDIVRYFLATAVVIAHYDILVGTDYWWPVSSGTAVGAFFGLSGFLVYSSYERHEDWRRYVRSRARRILPAYTFIVLVCAIGLAFVSTLTLSEYFTSSEFWRYLGSNICFLNFLQPTLPGVFEGSAVPAVNGSLWTLKVEWMLYLSIPIVFWIARKSGWGRVRTIVGICLLSIIYRIAMESLHEQTGREIYHVLSYQFAGQMVYFFSGALFHHYLSRISQNKLRWFVLSFIAVTIALSLRHLSEASLVSQIIVDSLFQMSLVCMILVISIARPVWEGIARVGNCSYEMYLFHFPLIHLIVLAGLPDKWGRGLTFALTYILIFLAAWIFNRMTEHLLHRKGSENSRFIRG